MFTVPLPRELVHIHGCFSVQSFGVAVLIAILTFSWLVQRDKRFSTFMTPGAFDKLLLVGIALGIVGGRLFYIALYWPSLTWAELPQFWHGGVALLGTAAALLVGLPLYLRAQRVPLLPFADLLATYLPLLQAIARLGCFFAGCCWGMPSMVPWAVQYTDAASLAPQFVTLHPTQLYSACMLFGIFLLLYWGKKTLLAMPGQLTCVYLLCMSAERFCIDFLRGDTLATKLLLLPLTVQQTAAFVIFCASASALVALRLYYKRVIHVRP